MKKKLSGQIILFATIGICIGIFLKFFVIDILSVSGESMEPALKNGSKVLLNRLSYGLAIPFGDRLFVKWASPKQGDVVIYLYDNKYVIKRCAATGGMALEFSYDSSYTLNVGGLSIELTEQQYHLLKGSTEVPEGTILAIGDNHRLSLDSRNYGFVPEKNILGKVICK